MAYLAREGGFGVTFGAEHMAAGRHHWLEEEVQTDGALQLEGGALVACEAALDD